MRNKSRRAFGASSRSPSSLRISDQPGNRRRKREAALASLLGCRICQNRQSRQTHLFTCGFVLTG